MIDDVKKITSNNVELAIDGLKNYNIEPKYINP